MADAFADLLPTLYRRHTVDAPFEPNAKQAGKRALSNAALSLLTRNDDGVLAQEQYDAADNMTQQLSALANLVRAGRGNKAVEAFEAQWKADRLVMDKWFGLQVMEADPEDAHEVVETLTKHPDFNWKNPNRFRALLGGLAPRMQPWLRARTVAGLSAPMGDALDGALLLAGYGRAAR